MNQYITEIEEECEINLNWYYHFSKYNLEIYKNILEEGIKCGHLLNKTHCGKNNGPFYISLTILTIPDNDLFLGYVSNPYLYHSFILDNINPIECENFITHKEYKQYRNTEDKRRYSSYLFGEYQYYYFIKSNFIKGIQYDLYSCLANEQEGTYMYNNSINEVLQLIDLLEELNIDIPIYDYSRRDKTLVHKINKEKFKYYQKKV